jgi:hypothetical protein
MLFFLLDEKNCSSQSKINSDLSSDSLEDEDTSTKEDKSDNIFDLNSLYKRSLSK